MSFIKVQAQQAISASQNLMDFVIPASFGGIDMDRSYLQLISRVETTTKDPATGVGIHNFNCSFDVSMDHQRGALNNSVLIRNTRLSSSKKGQLESVRRADLLNQTLQHYTRNSADRQGCQYKDLSQTADPHNQVQSIYRNLVGNGSVVSTEVESPVRIEMRDLFGLGRSRLNLNSLGDLHIHLEGNFNDSGTDKLLTEVPNGLPYVIVDESLNEDMGQTIKNLNGENRFWKTNVATGTKSSKVLLIQVETPAAGIEHSIDALTDKSNSPYYVGQKLGFWTADKADKGSLSKAAVIEQIEFIQSTPNEDGAKSRGYQIKLTFATDWCDGTGVTADPTEIFLYPIKAATAKWKLLRAELVLCQINNAPKSTGITYKTYNTIEDFAASTTEFQRQYQLPANAIANLVCFDSNPSVSNSNDATITSYTLRSDNVDIVNRPINISTNVALGRQRDPLHAIMLEKTLSRMNLPFKNYTEVFPTAVVEPHTLLTFDPGETGLMLGHLDHNVVFNDSAFTGLAQGTYNDVPVTVPAGTDGKDATLEIVMGAGTAFLDIETIYFSAAGTGYKVGDVLTVTATTPATGKFTITLQEYMFASDTDGHGFGLPNVNEVIPTIGGATDTNDKQGVLVLPAPLPLTSQPKLFQINITKSTATPMNLVQFQQVIRQIKF